MPNSDSEIQDLQPSVPNTSCSKTIIDSIKMFNG